MDRGQHSFNKRLRRLGRKHRAMQNGYATLVRPDGLIVAKPRRTGSPLSFRPLIYCLAGLLLFKGILMAQLGPGVYLDRLERLQAGTAVEQAGAWVMQPDRASEWISGQIKALLP